MKTMDKISSTKFFIGIDVSKCYFDVALLVVKDHTKQPVVTSQFENTQQGIHYFGKWLKSHKVSMGGDSLAVIENTGIYHRLIWSFCSRMNLPLHIGNAAHIKWIFGIARGKNDKIDSLRLCRYAFKEADTLKATSVLDPDLILLKDLIAARTRLLKQRSGLLTSINELECTNDKAHVKLVEDSLKSAIQGITTSIIDLELQIKKLVNGNRAFKENYELLISIPGIGTVTATYLIACTANFAGRPTGKQLACYAGVVPFENSSGSSIRGRAKVHQMANKELKRLLHMGAISARKNNKEFQTYYNRKKEEGKHSMSILNAIRNKIALRVAAVIKNKTKYIDHYLEAG